MGENPSLLTGTNIEHAGEHNKRVVLHAIRVNGVSTRAEIARTTGLTNATVTNITNRLLDLKLLDRAGQRRRGRGQPATKLPVNPAGAYAIGLNVDRDHLTMVIVDFASAVRGRIGRETAFPMPENVRAFYQEEIAVLLATAGIGADAVAGIGIALPDEMGEVDLPGRPASYARWNDTDLGALFGDLGPRRHSGRERRRCGRDRRDAVRAGAALCQLLLPAGYLCAGRRAGREFAVRSRRARALGRNRLPDGR